MSSRIEQIIEEIEEYIDRDCKFQPLSTTKIIVNKEHLDELLKELRMKTPDEIKRYQKIIANRDAILADAQAKADAMIEEAQVQTTELVSEHEIMCRHMRRRTRSLRRPPPRRRRLLITRRGTPMRSGSERSSIQTICLRTRRALSDILSTVIQLNMTVLSTHFRSVMIQSAPTVRSWMFRKKIRITVPWTVQFRR